MFRSSNDSLRHRCRTGLRAARHRRSGTQSRDSRSASRPARRHRTRHRPVRLQPSVAMKSDSCSAPQFKPTVAQSAWHLMTRRRSRSEPQDRRGLAAALIRARTASPVSRRPDSHVLLISRNITLPPECGQAARPSCDRRCNPERIELLGPFRRRLTLGHRIATAQIAPNRVARLSRRPRQTPGCSPLCFFKTANSICSSAFSIGPLPHGGTHLMRWVRSDGAGRVSVSHCR